MWRQNYEPVVSHAKQTAEAKAEGNTEKNKSQEKKIMLILAEYIYIHTSVYIYMNM